MAAFAGSSTRTVRTRRWSLPTITRSVAPCPGTGRSSLPGSAAASDLAERSYRGS